MKVKSESEVAQSCLTLSDRVDCHLPGSSVHRIFQARVVEWVAIAFSDYRPKLSIFSELSYLRMTSRKKRKNIALTRWTFVGKVMSLPFNMLFMFVITFLPRKKHLSISWLQSRSEMILEPKINVSIHCFHCFCIYFP